MEVRVPSSSVPTDGGIGGRKAWNKVPSSGFQWVSPSPSQAEVAELVKLFPEVIQIPTEELVKGSAVWENQAIVARSFLRWIPPEAVIREFRRAGIPGDIEAVSLAFRCSIFKFSDAGSKQMALERAWVVNGQPLATEPWSPEFFPSESSVTKALLWIRLPSLPLEFWSEDILRIVLAPAGSLICLDSQTKQRNRGAFARACVCVDMIRPLRPGVRIRGVRNPFWQSFQYEHLEGICPKCASLHLNGVCCDLLENEAVAGSLRFGPWMSALRQRRTPSPPSMVEDLKRKGKGGFMEARSTAPAENWKEPSKFARRKGPVTGSKLPPSSSVESEREVAGGLKESQVHSQPARSSATVIISGSTVAQRGVGSVSKIDTASSFISENPFSVLGSDRWAGRTPVVRDVRPGPSKRARSLKNESYTNKSTQ